MMNAPSKQETSPAGRNAWAEAAAEYHRHDAPRLAHAEQGGGSQRPPTRPEVGDEVFSKSFERNGTVVRIDADGIWVDFWNRPQAAVLQSAEHLDVPRETVWLYDEEGGGGCQIGSEYTDNRTWRRFTLLGGSVPMRWDEERDRDVECPGEHADYYRYARVRWDNGEEGLVPGECVWALIDTPDRLEPPPLGFLSYDEMVNLPDPEWLVQGVVQEATAALLFGKSNVFKSFLGIDLLCSVATGTPWHGNEVKGPAPCLYVATEGSRGVGKQRIPGWMEAHHIGPELRQNVFMYPQEIALDDDNAVSDLLRTCGNVKARRLLAEGQKVANAEDPSDAFAFVVIDIFGSSMMGPETSDETARAWVRNINRIMREIGCAVLTVAHTGWADDSRARMHTHFWGSFDSRMRAEGDKNTLTTVLKIDRHKDAESVGEWGFRLEKVYVPAGGTTLVPHLCDEVETRQRRRVSGKPAAALQALSESIAEHGKRIVGQNYPTCPVVTVETWRASCDRHGLTDSGNHESARKAFNRAKEKLIQLGIVRQSDNFVWRVDDGDRMPPVGQTPVVI